MRPKLNELFLEEYNEFYKMMKLPQDGSTFKHFSEALYATDVCLQHALCPLVNFTEVKPYFSGKHKLYGDKHECSVLPNGLAINALEQYHGSIHDACILKDKKKKHFCMLKKIANKLRKWIVQRVMRGHKSLVIFVKQSICCH